ncbi:hypothetical protein M1446_03805 [Candidatus Dependentiae bacterium]|nr:hypothetical protein [Candidatus Dependentiae bacterium]
MKYTKTLFASLTICSLFSNQQHIVKDGHPILLKSQVLHVIDGVPFGIDEFAIYDMIIVGHNLRELQNGKKDASGNKIGKYEIQGQKYTLNELVEEEEKDRNNPKIKELLEEVKDDFKRFMIKFSDKIKDPTTKEFMTQLIHESCDIRNRKDSYLLSWSKQKETDFDAMRNDVKTLKDCNIFFTDLLNFLCDVIHSCPKGVKRYKELKHTLESHHKSEHAA